MRHRVCAILVLVAAPALAEQGKLRAVAPAAGGLDGVEAVVEAGALKVRRCRPECAGDFKSIAIPLERSRLDLGAARVSDVAIGEGRHVVHVRVPDAQRKDLAFEAILSGASDDPIFAGLTGYTRGEEGDRSGQAILFYDRGPEAKYVLVAEAREDTRICGQVTTPLTARGLDPKTMQLRGATLHRIDKGARDAAARVVAHARPSPRPPLAHVLFATGGSAPGAQALTDGKPETTWSEKRPGDGHGEFATMRAPSEVPIHAVTVSIAPPAPKADGAAPRTFFLATDHRLFHVTMPEDAWLKPGASYEIPLPEPVKTTCLAVVLDEAYARGLAAPEISFSEVAAVTKFDLDGATIDDVAKELSTPARSEEAAALLRRSGDDGLAAVARRWSAIDASARALAVDVAASAGTCEGPAADLLTRALADKESEVRRRALGRIERCGKAATASLAAAVRAGDEPRRAAAAPLLAAIAPSAAVDPIGDALGQGNPETRRALRGAFARASASASRDKLLSLLKRDLAPTARLDLLRAMGPKLSELRPESATSIAEVLQGRPEMATRYLLLQPLAQLARSRDATSGELTRLSEFARRDPEWPVRARAVELSAEIPLLFPTIVAAAADPEPRVREAALKAMATGRIASGADAAEKALAKDTWTFVRVAAAEALGASNRDAGLAAALADASPKVRVAAITALGNQRATKHASKILERLTDGKEDVEVRALAARTLGTMCVSSATDRLTRLALLSRAPVDEADERIGMAAIDALTSLHPSDLEKRLAPLRGKEVRLPVRRAVELALHNAKQTNHSASEAEESADESPARTTCKP